MAGLASRWSIEPPGTRGTCSGTCHGSRVDTRSDPFRGSDGVTAGVTRGIREHEARHEDSASGLSGQKLSKVGADAVSAVLHRLCAGERDLAAEDLESRSDVDRGTESLLRGGGIPVDGPPTVGMMKYRASVTFETDSSAPETHRVEISAGSHQTAASRAVKAAKTAYPNRRPSSIVVLLELDRTCAE